MKKVLIVSGLLIFLLFPDRAGAQQLLFPESFPVVFDSVNRLKGNVLPAIEVRKQNELYTNFQLESSISYKIQQTGLTLANKFDLVRSSGETILSGGYGYLRYKEFMKRLPFVVEYYTQYQFLGFRGMEHRFAGGINFRWEILKDFLGGVFVGAGPFYEYEQWNHTGVVEPVDVPAEATVSHNQIKANAYASTQAYFLDNRIVAKLAVYGNFGFSESTPGAPRYAGDAYLAYQLTEYLSVGARYQMIYDENPVVPIDELWYVYTTQFALSF